MSEKMPQPSEINLAPQPTYVEQMAAALEAGDQAALAVANVYYIDTIMPDAQANSSRSKVYTEVHAAGDGYIITPSVQDSSVHWAHVGREHSMFDSARPPYHRNEADFLEQELGNTFQLTTKSVVAKGELSVTPEGKYLLEIGEIRNKGASEFNWTSDFAKNAPNYPSFDLVYKPLYEDIEQSLNKELPLKLHTDMYARRLRLENEQPGVRSGIVTGVEDIVMPAVPRQRDRNLQRHGRLTLEAVEGNVGIHQPVYDAAKLKRPGLFTIKAGDFEQQVSIHYTLDDTNGRANISIIYNNAERDSSAFEDLQAMIRAAVEGYVSEELPNATDRKITERFENVDIRV